jgi:hypothetical protein
MSRYLFAVAALVLAMPAFSAAPVPAQAVKGAAYPYPARAPIVVCLNGYDQARERLTKLLTAALPNEVPKLTKRLDGELAKILKGRKLDAIRKDARLFVVVNDLANLFGEDHLPISVLVPVTTYKAFRESFLTRDELKTFDAGRDNVDAIKTEAFGDEITIHMVDLKDYVAITPDKATADTYAGKYNRATSEQMGAELAESFVKADVAVAVNMDAINDQFGDQIKGFRGLIDFGIQQAAQQGALPGLSPKQMDALKVLLKGGFQGIEDCRAILVTAEFKDNGVALKVQARFAENTPSSRLLSMERPVAFADVSRLPAGLGLYGGIHFGRTITEVIRDISQNLSTTAEDVQGTKLIEGHTKDLLAAGHQGDISATKMPGVSMTISRYKDPVKAAKALTKTYKAIAAGGRVNSVIVKAAPRVGDEAETHGDFTFSEILLKYDFAATVADLPDQVKDATLQSLKRNMTEESTMWIGTDKKVVVQIVAKNWDEAKKLLDHYRDRKQSIGADAGFKLTRSQLPAEANFLMIAETSSALSTMFESIRSMGDAVPNFPHIPNLTAPKGEPTYVGVAVVLKGEIASVNVFIPTGAIAVGGKFLAPLFKNVE